MADVTLEALGSQIEQLLRELAGLRKELSGIRAAQTDLSNGQIALAQALLHIKRDGVIKDIFARIDGQVRKLEEEKGRAEER
jgi:predicted  nucleic acid-binding Zn-ribbon protein